MAFNIYHQTTNFYQPGDGRSRSLTPQLFGVIMLVAVIMLVVVIMLGTALMYFLGVPGTIIMEVLEVVATAVGGSMLC
jgi:hypothetical protein